MSSLRTRLFIILVTATSLIWLFAIGWISVETKHEVEKVLDSRLEGGLFLGSVGNDDATCGLLFGVDPLDHDAVVKRTEFHAILLGFCDYCWIDSRNERVLAAPHVDL